MTQSSLFDFAVREAAAGLPDRTGAHAGRVTSHRARRSSPETAPRSRRSDPETSVRAEARMRRTGRMAEQRSAAQRLVELFPLCTATELAERSLPLDFARCLDDVGQGADVTARRFALCRRLSECDVHSEPALFRRERRWVPGRRA